MASYQQNSPYAYNPSVYLALVATILFSALTCLLAFRMTQTRTWESVFFVLGGLAQLSGYVARVVSTQDVSNRAAYGVQSILLLLGPTILMFSVNTIQVTFARALDAERFYWVTVTWAKSLYLSLNTSLILIQAIAGIMTVASTSIATITVGAKITIAIYVIQAAFWGFTMAENIHMSILLGRHPTEQSRRYLPNWKHWNQLFGLSICIIGFGRNIMRLTMAGGVSFLVDNEWPSYAFDGYQMLVVMGTWAIFYLPGECQKLTYKNESHGLLHTQRSEDEETLRTTS